MEDSRDSFSFEIDDLSKSSTNSELFGSEEIADISELLEDFGKKRDDERNSEDLRVSSEESKTKDLKSRIPILKERGMLDDRTKSEESLLASKIPVRVTSSSSGTANRISDKEQFKRMEKMADGTKASGMKQEEMEPEDEKGFDPESVTSLRRHVAVGEEENMKYAAKKSSVNSLDVDERVKQESNLGLCLNAEENSPPKENVKSCHERLGEKCDESIGTKSEITEAESSANFLLEQTESKRAKNYQNSKKFSMIDDAGEVMSEIESMSEKEGKQNVNIKDLNIQGVQEKTNISLEQRETKRERNQEDEISTLIGVDSESMTEKELMNENLSDQNVKKKNLNGQECVKNEKHSDDIVIPSLPVDDEGSDEDSLNNGNDKMTKNYMSNGIQFVKCTNQGERIDFDSPPLEADNEEVNKEHSKFKNCEKNEECASDQEDIATPSLVHDDISCSDDIEKLKDKSHRKRKKNDPGEESRLPNLKQQENVTVALVAPEGSDLGKADDTSCVMEDQKARVCETNLMPNTEVDPSLTHGGDGGDHEPNHEERTKIHDLNDGSKVNQNHDGISSTRVDGGGARVNDNKSEKLIGKACAEKAQNGKKSDLDNLTTRDDVEFSSIAEDVEGMGEGKLCYGKDYIKPEETIWNKNYLTKTECNIDDFEDSATLVDNGIVRKMSTKNDQSKHESEQQSEDLSDGEKEHDMTDGDSRGACLKLGDDGDERTMKDKIRKPNYEEKEEEIKAEFGTLKDPSSNSDNNLQNDEDVSNKSWDYSNIEFDDADNNYDVPDYDVKSKKPANSFSKAVQSIEEKGDIPERKYGKKENDAFSDEANTSDHEVQHESKTKSTEEPRSKDIEDYEVEQIPKPILAESPKINCLEIDGTIKSGKNFPFNKNAPVPAPRKKKKSATAALTSRENNVNSNETIASNEELKEKYEFSSEISCEEKPQQLRHNENFASVEKEKAVVTEVKGTNGSLKFGRKDYDDYVDSKRKDLITGCKNEYKSEQRCLEDTLIPHNNKNENRKGHIGGPAGKFAKTRLKTEEPLSSEKIPVVAPRSEYGQIGSKSDQFRDVATLQTLHENKPHIEYRQEEKTERYDSENYLLPQDISAFSPPFCSTPYFEGVSNITPEVQAPFDEDKFIGKFSDEEAEPNGPYELPDKRQISSQEKKDEAEIDYGPENDIKIGPLSKEGGHYKAKLAAEDDGVFSKCMTVKNDVGYEDDDSIYATSIDFENPTWRERNIAVKSPEYEEANVGLRVGVASSVLTDDVTRDIRKVGTSYYYGDRKDDAVGSFRHSDDTMKRREERTICDKKDHDGPIWRTQQPSHKGQSYQTEAMRHQRPSVPLSGGVNLCGTQPYVHDLLKLPCTNTDQTSHRLFKSTERNYLGKPLPRNSAFVPFESSVRGKVGYPKKRGSPKEKRWNRLTEDCNKDRNCAGYMKYTSDSNQNPIELVQKKRDKFDYENCLPIDARYASQRTQSDDTSFAMPVQLNFNTEPRIERRFDHVQHSTSKNETNLSGFGSQIGTLDVITFPLSRGPGIAVERIDNIGTSGIYVKEIVEDGDAYHDGRLRPGDRLLTINGYNLSIASLSQAKSVLRKLKHAQSESFATIRFVRESDDISVDDMDSSLDRSVTLPISPNETTHIEPNTIGEQHVYHDSSYLKEELILPNPLMTSTPTCSRKSEDHTLWSVNYHNLHDGLLMIPPNTKVHLSQLESSLSYLGLSFSRYQKDLLRNQLEVDSQGYVVYEEFATAARNIYSLDLSVKEPLAYLEQEMPKSLPDIVPRPSIDSVLASRRELDQLVCEKDQIKEEIQEIKKRLTKKAKVLRKMEDELAEVRNGLRQVQNRKMTLIKEEKDLEKARARASSKTQDNMTAISSLEQEIINLKASQVVPITSKLVSKCASVNKQTQNLVMRVRSVEMSNRNYQYVTQKLMAFAHKVHKLQHEGATSSLDHTYQTVDQIPVSKSRGVKSRDRKSHDQNEFLSREARKVISTVQGILSHEPLPFGWEEAYTEKGFKFYVDHVSGVTTWRLPNTSTDDQLK